MLPLIAGVTFLLLQKIIDAVLKRLCMILYTLEYASKTHFQRTVILINIVMMQ